MRRFANCFIILFLIDANISVIDDILQASGVDFSALTSTRIFVAYLVIGLSMVVFGLLGIDRRLPKRVFLPLTLFCFWGSLSFWPLFDLLPRVSFSLGQLILGGLALVTLRWSYGQYLLPVELFQRSLFSWRNTLAFTVVNVLLLPLMLVFSVFSLADSYLDHSTAGFMRISPVGIYTSERTYHRDNQAIHLVAMMHIARKGFYEELTASLPAKETIILAEGVTDQDQLLKNKFHYGKLASAAGLSSQETMHLDGNRLDSKGNLERDETKPDILRADIDVNRFDPQTIEFLNVIGRTIMSDEPLAQGFKAYLDWVQIHGTPEMFAGLMHDILEKRNKVVIDTLEDSLAEYKTIVVPWGGMHMPAIEAGVLQQGFVPGEKKERLLFTFSALSLTGKNE